MNSFYKKKNFYIDMLIIIFGCFLSSLGVNLFLANAKLLSGGVTGIALILEYSFNIQSGLIVMIINIPLLFLSYNFLSKKFTFYTTVGMFSFSIFLMLTKQLSQFINIDDILVLCIYGGLLTGVGAGFIFYRNGSTGGIDIITMVIRKKYSNYDIGKLNFAFNIIIVIISASIFGIPQSLYTLISMFVQTIVLDKILNGFTSKKLLLILSDNEQDIIDYVIKDLHRGITSIHAEGEYTHKQKKMLYIAVTSSQLISLKTKILKIDPKAFITIVDVSEVKGKGFQSI